LTSLNQKVTSTTNTFFVILYLKTGESQVQMTSSCLMVIKLFEYKFYSRTPNLSNQNAVFIEYDVLIGWVFFMQILYSYSKIVQSERSMYWICFNLI